MVLSGTGKVIADGRDLGFVRYQIHVRVSSGLNSADGTISGDPELLLQAFESRTGMCKLVRDDCGYEVTFGITSLPGMSSVAQIAISGSPGPLR